MEQEELTTPRDLVNSIPERQNSEPLLNKLRASRYLHSRAKKFLGISIVASIVVPILLAPLALRDEAWRIPFAFWGVLASVLGVFLEYRQKHFTAKAAMVQESFDCDLLGLEWNAAKGKEPSPEEVSLASRKFSGSEAKIRNWYSAHAGELPIELGRLICQRANCSWEEGLRNKIAAACAVAATALVVLTITTAVIIDSARDGVLYAAAILPALLFLIKSAFDHHHASATSKRLRDFADETIQGARCTFDRATLTDTSRRLQDEILSRRVAAPPVFEWIYERLRDENEENMDSAALQLVEKLKVALEAVPKKG